MNPGKGSPIGNFCAQTREKQVMLKPGKTAEDDRCRLEGLASREASASVSGSWGRKPLRKLEHWGHKEGGNYGRRGILACIYGSMCAPRSHLRAPGEDLRRGVRSVVWTGAMAWCWFGEADEETVSAKRETQAFWQTERAGRKEHAEGAKLLRRLQKAPEKLYKVGTWKTDSECHSWKMRLRTAPQTQWKHIDLAEKAPPTGIIFGHGD